MSGSLNCDVVCWDSETSDTDVRHGQILDFGLVSANTTDLVETGSTSIRIKRLSYCIPAYGALSTNRLDPYSLEGHDRVDEFQAAEAICKALSPTRPGRPLLDMGYNILSFDEEILRSVLFRNLLDPYVTSAKGVSRLDLLPAARLAHALDPKAFPCGLDDEGGPSFRLERIAPANGIGLKAHDAMEDARATLSLARTMRGAVPAAWETAVRAADRYEAERVFDRASLNDDPVWVLRGGNQPVLEALFPIAKHNKLLILLDAGKAEACVADGADSLDVDNWRDSPIVRCRTNRMPIILPAPAAEILREMHPEAFASAERPRPPAGWSDFKQALGRRAKSDDWTPPQNPTAEERIYSGFTDWPEKDAAKAFRRARSWEERTRLYVGLRDDRNREFAARSIVEHGALTPSEIAEIAGDKVAEEIMKHAAVAFDRPFADADARWMTIAKAREEGREDARYSAWLEDVATPQSSFAAPPVPVETSPKGQIGWSF